VKVATVLPAVLVTVGLFVLSGFLLAAIFGVSFVVPWIGGLPVATVLFLRRQFARAALYVFERMGLGPLVNKSVDWLIDIVWWRTPEPMQQRFDAWWRRMKMRLRRWVIGPRRSVVRRMSRMRFKSRSKTEEPGDAKADTSHRSSTNPRKEETLARTSHSS
jgi:glucose dehydrogenase